MLLLKTVKEVRAWVKDMRTQGNEIGFVPTMGFLHEGHLSLARTARKENSAVIMSIFVNPLQFGPKEDYSTYPRDLKRDCALAESAGVDVIFNPEVEEIYPEYPQLTTVDVKGITTVLCGASRPGHFTGVTTVVSILFNIVQPDRAYFGQKDYQQVQVIKTMVTDLNIPVVIRTVPIMREPDGLAMSSRNTFLLTTERNEALCLNEALKLCRAMFLKGEKRSTELIKAMKEHIEREPSASIDYIEICDSRSLQGVLTVKERVVVAMAVRIGKTRLIDNMILGGEGNVPDNDEI